MMFSGINCSLNQTSTNVFNHTAEEGFSVDEYPQVIRVFYICFLVICLIIGVPGNILIATVYGCLNNKSTTDWFILFVAIFDTLICCLEVPFFLSFEIVNWKINTNNAICQVFVWISQSLTLSSCILLCLIAVDRFQKICMPFRASMTPKAAKHAGALSLAVSVFLSLPVFLLYGNDSQGECQILEEHQKSLFHGIYTTAFFAVFVLMFLLVTVSYFQVARRLRQRALVSQSLIECLSQTNIPQSRSTMNEIISITGARNNNITPPAITIQITDSSLENSVENVSQSVSPMSCSSWGSLPEQTGRDQCLGVSIPESNKMTSHDQFLLRVPQSWPTSEVDLPNSPPYSADLFIASSLAKSSNKMARRSSTSKENTVTVLLFTITVVFILSWILPWYIFIYRYYMLETCSESSLTPAMMHYGPNLYLLNHFSNPLVYSLMSRSFRNNVKMCIRKVL